MNEVYSFRMNRFLFFVSKIENEKKQKTPKKHIYNLIVVVMLEFFTEQNRNTTIFD